MQGVTALVGLPAHRSQEHLPSLNAGLSRVFQGSCTNDLNRRVDPQTDSSRLTAKITALEPTSCHRETKISLPLWLPVSGQTWVICPSPSSQLAFCLWPAWSKELSVLGVRVSKAVPPESNKDQCLRTQSTSPVRPYLRLPWLLKEGTLSFSRGQFFLPFFVWRFQETGSFLLVILPFSSLRPSTTLFCLPICSTILHSPVDILTPVEAQQSNSNHHQEPLGLLNPQAQSQ